MMDYLIDTPKEKHFRKALSLLNYVRNDIQLTDDMYELAYNYYQKAYTSGYPRRH